MYTNSQMAGASNPGDVLYIMRVLLFIAFLSMGYALSRPRSTPAKKEEGLLLPDTSQEWPGLLPWQTNASDKAVVKYAGAQEKKWRRWNDAMFERSN